MEVEQATAQDAPAQVNEVPTCHGLNSSYVKLVTKDGHKFYIQRKYAKASKTIMNMLEGPAPMERGDSDLNEVKLDEIDSHAMARTAEYLCYNQKYQDAWYQVPDFAIDEKIAEDVLYTACFLEC